MAKKFDIAFTYTAKGSVEIEAEDEAAAEVKARERLMELREMGDLASGARHAGDISWDDDDVEVM